MRSPFQGVYVALPTPFRDGRLDLEAFEELIEFHAAHKTDGLVVIGTTGESVTLNDFEQRSLIHAAVELSRGRLPIVAGVGTNCTRTSVERARFAASCGVDGLLVVTPYYNKPSRKGMLLHFGAVAEASQTPVILYNVPSRTGVDLRPDVAAEIAERHPNVVAIKEAGTSLERVRELVQRTGLSVLCGEDSLTREFVLLGAAGTISVLGNVVPDELAELIREARPGGDPRRAEELAFHLQPLARDLFVESNPVPVKYALSRMGLCSPEVRPPLAELEDASRARLDETLASYGLVERVAQSATN